MIKYKCSACGEYNDLELCPKCGKNGKRVSVVYWCKEHNVPSYEEHCSITGKINERLGSDVRPVFPEERLLLEILLDSPMKYIDSSVWCITGGRYVVDGKIITINMKSLSERNIPDIIKKIHVYDKNNTYTAFNKYAKAFIEENKARYNYISTEAIDFINENIAKLSTESMFVSFSGGKDSTVTSDLVLRATGNPRIIHLYGDTTLEFPETLKYIEKFKSNHKQTPLLIANNKEKDFYELCEQIGPPSRVMRWCCTVFKTGAITNKINSMYKNKSSIISFHGIRRFESISRSKYDRESTDSKIAKQITLSPIIDWTDLDVWLYLLTREVEFNQAYRYGFTRVGCWCCPNNSNWSAFLSKIYMPEQYEKFRNMLIDFAKSVGKPDPEEYVDGGWWKARQGGNGVSHSKTAAVSFEPCALEKDAFNYVLNKPITEELYEFFKPFGSLNFDLGKSRLGEVYILNVAGVPIMKLAGKIGSKELKVSILKLPVAGCKNISSAEGKIKCQIVKYQMCVNCSGCISTCKYDAITIHDRNGKIEYKINENKCRHCFECINHYTGGCYMKKVLAVKGD